MVRSVSSEQIGVLMEEKKGYTAALVEYFSCASRLECCQIFLPCMFSFCRGSCRCCHLEYRRSSTGDAFLLLNRGATWLSYVNSLKNDGAISCKVNVRAQNPW